MSGTGGETRKGMTREQVRDRFLALMKENARVDPAALRDEARLREDLSLDSLDFTAVVNEVEIEWGIVIPDAGAAQAKTIGDVVELLWQRLA